MGIVYEALNRSEKQKDKRATATGRAGHHQAQPAPTKEDFDFVNYSLGTPTAEELDRIQQNLAQEEERVESQTRPAREVELSVNRIDPHLVQFYDCNPLASDQYNKLAGLLIAAQATRPVKRLFIASANHGDGRTLVTLNLGCALAHANKRVLVVDTDFRRPSVLRLLGLQGEAGIAEVLRNGLAPGSAGIKVLPHGFVVLPTREPIDNPAQLLSSNSFREMLNAFDSQFDFLLFDSSPLADSADKNLLASLTNAALLVVRSEKTRSGDLGKAIAPLTEQQIFGVVLNCH